jgi:hypothetical protein
MSLSQMIGQLISAIKAIHAGTIEAGDMAIVDVLGGEVLPVVAPQVSSAIEDSWAEVAGMAEGCWCAGGNVRYCIGGGDNFASAELGRT